MSRKVEPRTIRKARKDRKCTEHYCLIKAGEHYLYSVAPPWHDCNDSGKWWVIAACLRCAKRYGLHDNETQKQAEALGPAQEVRDGNL